MFLAVSTRILISSQACVEHRLDSANITAKPGYSVSVVLASQGYPGNYDKGKAIILPDTPSGKSVWSPRTVTLFVM